jgi:hypothetical protein
MTDTSTTQPNAESRVRLATPERRNADRALSLFQVGATLKAEMPDKDKLRIIERAYVATQEDR